MNLNPKRSSLAILAGILIGLLISIFVQPACWGPIAGVFAAAYLAKVSSPKEGAIVGVITLTPIGIYAAVAAVIQIRTADVLSTLVMIPFLSVAVVLLAGMGALYGLIIGKLFQITKDRELFL